MVAAVASRPRYWMLHPDRSVSPCTLMERCAMTDEQCRVALDEIDGVTVSTVFLSLDHAYEGPPAIFETMVFGGEHDEFQERYATWDEAVVGHEKACQMVREHE